MIINIFIIYLLAGCCTGFLSGLFGLGGGIIVVPALLSIFQLTQAVPETQAMHFAVGTSLAIILWTALASIHTHRRQNAILWPICFDLLKGIVLGVILGGFAANFIPTQKLKFIFGFFLVLIAAKTLKTSNTTQIHTFPRPLIHHLISILIGFSSGLLGIGGGVLIVPYLTWCGVDIRKVTAISAACTLVVALTGSIFFAVTSASSAESVPMTIGHIYWPAVLFMAIPAMLTTPLGVLLHYRLPPKPLRILFAILLIATGGYLMSK